MFDSKGQSTAVGYGRYRTRQSAVGAGLLGVGVPGRQKFCLTLASVKRGTLDALKAWIDLEVHSCTTLPSGA